jgi:glucuronoarabinoxylan endo-1,4-beta-xylanase
MSVSRRTFVRSGLAVAAATRARGVFAAEAKTYPAGIAATPDHIRQEIDGFGFSEAFHQAHAIQQLAEKDQTDLLNLMFSPTLGMGYSILRNEIGNGPTDSRPGQVASIEPEPGVFNWTGDEDQIWMMNEAKKRGCTRFLSSSWSPPAWMKTNNDEYAGELKPAMYQQFADYLADYVQQYKSRYNLDIYALSPQNEPNYTPTEKYASCRWTGAQLARFLHSNLIPTFTAKGVKAKIVIDEAGHWTDDAINEILADPVCAKGVDIVAAHAYAPTTAPYVSLESRTGQFNLANQLKKTIWQTEVSAGDAQITNMNDGVYWARVIHQHMIEDNVSAWLYWWGAAVTKSRSSLITLDMESKKYGLTKRFFTIGQFARFVRPGFHRVDANPTPAPNTYFSAYLAPNGKQLVCVAINDDSVEKQLLIQAGGFNAAKCVAFRTSDTEVHKRLPDTEPSAGGFAVTVSPLSVTTFVLVAA